MNTNEQREPSDEPVSSGVQTSMLIDESLWSYAYMSDATWPLDVQDWQIHAQKFSAVLVSYNEEPNFYSDGSPIGAMHRDPDGRIRYKAFEPPHRRGLFQDHEVSQGDSRREAEERAREVAW
ncbi:MAG: hypothetical protein ORN51_07195 [Akkermansiaceae bacterium]|nr:hypothetical protein [Akkermansiaceae bacterium]